MMEALISFIIILVCQALFAVFYYRVNRFGRRSGGIYP